jgi:hypothetical protein
MSESEYKDSYPTCTRTYSTLRVFSNLLAPSEITKMLEMVPTRFFRKGDAYAKGRLRRNANGWFYSTRKLSSSKDTRRHIDLILAKLEEKARILGSLRRKGCKIDITTCWVSGGQGGPMLMPEQMLKLGALGISVWWDIYFNSREEAKAEVPIVC